MKRLLLALLAALSLAPLPALAADAADELVEIQAGKPFTLRPDRAYLLLRSNTSVSPVLMRVPSAAELARYDAARREAFAKEGPKLVEKRNALIARKRAAETAGQPFKGQIPPEPSLENFNFVYHDIVNAQTLSMGRAFEKGEGMRTMLVEAVPGDYVLFGLGFNNILYTCLCLGTVSFTPEPGKITDLGTLLVAAATNKSDIPELAGETGRGPSMNGHLVTWAAAIRPAAAGTPVPAALANMAVVPAGYRATGKFVAPFAFNINRLAPIPGVLGYDRGKVLDLAKGAVAEDHYD